MAAIVKACTNSAYRKCNAVIIIIFVLLSCLGTVMAIYNIMKANFLFAAACAIATVLAVTYVLIRYATVYPTSLSIDRENLYMKNWDNDFMPYDYDNKIKVLSEFIPAKTKVTEIPAGDITMVIIGTKNFIKRNMSPDISPEKSFGKSVQKLEKSKDFYRKRMISSMDMIYVETFDRECCFMPIVKFNARDVIKVVGFIRRANPEVEILAGGKEYRSLLR